MSEANEKLLSRRDNPILIGNMRKAGKKVKLKPTRKRSSSKVISTINFSGESVTIDVKRYLYPENDIKT